MFNITLIKILDETYKRRFLCSWLDAWGSVHMGALPYMPRTVAKRA